MKGEEENQYTCLRNEKLNQMELSRHDSQEFFCVLKETFRTCVFPFASLSLVGKLSPPSAPPIARAWHYLVQTCKKRGEEGSLWMSISIHLLRKEIFIRRRANRWVYGRDI